MIIDSNIINIITIVTSITTLLALGFTIYQARLSKLALLETKKSIDQEKVNRQISLLPKVEWIIEVDVQLKMWQEKSEENYKKPTKALTEKDDKILKELSNKHIKKPSDLGLSKYQYEKMPEWLSQLWLSGAQYYYEGLGSMESIHKDGKPNYGLAEMLVQNCAESSYALAQLRTYISDMVPQVILDTPARINSGEFFIKE